MVQVMIAGAVLLVTGVYVTKTLKDQESLQKTASLRSTTHQQVKEFTEILTDSEICKATFAQNGALVTDATFTAIKGKDGQPIYSLNTKYVTGTIVEMIVEDYVPSSGLKYSPVKLRVNFELPEVRAAQSSFGGTRKAYRIPIYLITNNNIVQTCMSDSAGVVQEALEKACMEFGGTFDGATGTCKKLHGEDGIVLNFIKQYLCSAGGAGCTHPYANQECSGTDVRGVSHGNWVLSGFGPTGAKSCICVPRFDTCPNSGDYCPSTDLGTDWCNKDCGKGTWDPQDWGPDPSTRCAGDSFTQTASCGKSRSAVGTKNCTPVNTHPSGCPPTCTKGDKSGICQHCSI